MTPGAAQSSPKTQIFMFGPKENAQQFPGAKSPALLIGQLSAYFEQNRLAGRESWPRRTRADSRKSIIRAIKVPLEAMNRDRASANRKRSMANSCSNYL